MNKDMSVEKRFLRPEFHINEDVNKRIVYLESTKIKLQAEYEKMPEGSILVAPGKNDTNFRYYLREKTSDRIGVYLKADQSNIKKKYATKKYYKELIKHIENEIKQLKKIKSNCLEDSIISTYKSIGLGVIRLITPLNIDDETFVKLWCEEGYTGLGFEPNDNSSFYSDRNERMRSKSEVLIANTLNRMNIPYKYECPIQISNKLSLYPDFTILDVKNRKEKYWEHLGKMGDMAYVAKNIWKLDEYKKLNIRLGINLFVTYENGVSALGKDDILYTIEAICGTDNSYSPK